jgi:hypothetical protein
VDQHSTAPHTNGRWSASPQLLSLPPSPHAGGERLRSGGTKGAKATHSTEQQGQTPTPHEAHTNEGKKKHDGGDHEKRGDEQKQSVRLASPSLRSCAPRLPLCPAVSAASPAQIAQTALLMHGLMLLP